MAKAVGDELVRQGFAPTSHTTKETEPAGWYANVAQWPDRHEAAATPEIQVFLDRTLSDDTSNFWFGFSSDHEYMIDTLIEAVGIGKYADFDLKTDVDLEQVAAHSGLAREHADAFYFGKYDVGFRAQSDADLATEAADFIAQIVYAADPSVQERHDIEAIENDSSLSKTERRALVLARRGQGKFRADLFAAWGACALTGVETSALLRASHIQPWAKSTNRQRLDPHNGLLLSANADALFDRGLITFDDKGRIQISPRLSKQERKRLGIRSDMSLSRTPSLKQIPYLRMHRESFKS